MVPPQSLEMPLLNSDWISRRGKKGKGTWKMNTMQLLFGEYNVQTYHEPEEMNKIGENIQENGSNKKFRRMPTPVLTRW